MNNFLLILNYFFQSIIIYSLRWDQHKNLYFTGVSLLESQAFWLPQPLLQSPFAGLIVTKITLKQIWTKSKPGIRKLGNEPVAILDGRMQNLPLRQKYVEAYAKEKVGFFICLKELLFHSSILNALLKSAFVVAMATIFLPWLIFSPKRVNYAKFSAEILSLKAMLDYMEDNEIKKVYSFFIFRGFSNLEAIVMKRKGIRINKVTSVTPLSFHNHTTIADDLIVNTQYQIEEIPHFQSTLQVERVMHWAPEQSLTWEKKYSTGSYGPIPKAHIGYYSSGHWLRKKLEHLGTGRGDAQSDELLQDYLREFMLINPHLKLAIFTHPMEKLSPQIFAEACGYYAEKFAGIQIEMVSPKVNTIGNLEYVDVAVGVISSTLTERLYFGFKTLFAPFKVRNFPLKGTSIVPIAPRKKELFFTTLEQTLNQTKAEFFDFNALNSYRFKERDVKLEVEKIFRK